MQAEGAEANVVVRGDEPSSAGQGVGPVRAAPGATAAGVMPDGGMVVEAGLVLVVEDRFDVEREPSTAPTVESTTTTATAPAASCRRRRACCWRAADAALAR